MGELVIFFISAARDSEDEFRSRMVVAPMDLRKSVCVREAVVIIGENPDSFASWMTVESTLVSIKSWHVKLDCAYPFVQQSWHHQGRREESLKIFPRRHRKLEA